jgi:cytoskeleton protein RodZ
MGRMSETPETDTGAAVTPGRAPGDILRQAREARNLSVAAIATQLNLDLRTVEALERGEQDKLPAPIFVRGYLRGYARLVGVSENDVLGAYRALTPQSEPVPRAVGVRSAPLRPAFRGPLVPWRGLLLTVVLIAVVALAVVYGPRLLTSFLGEGVSEDAASPQLGLPLPGDGGDDAAAEPATPGGAGGLELPLPEPHPIPAEEPPPPADAGQEPDLPDTGDFEPAAAPPVSAGTAAESRAESTVESTPAAPAVTAAPDEVRLEFRFHEDSWVEVRGADRARLLFGLMRRDETRSVTGKAPVSVVLGNAATVELQVNGSRFDLAPHIRNNIARFEVRAAN